MTPDPAPSSAISWSDDLNTGVTVLDDQHRLLDRVLQSLLQTLESRSQTRDVAARLEQLQSLAEEHFATEEALMEVYGYPHLGPHRAEHEALVEHLRGQLQAFLAPEAPPLELLILEVRRIFHQHVRQVDQDYATYLRDTLGYKPLV